MNTLADDGMPLNHFYATYAPKPADLPDVDAVRKGSERHRHELMALRAAPTAQDYTGPGAVRSARRCAACWRKCWAQR